MEINITDLDYCKVKIAYKADIEDVRQQRQRVAREMSKTWDVPGFRKGKASAEVIRLSFPKEVEGYLRQEMLSKAYADSIAEKNIKPFGGPEIISNKLEGNNFEAELSVHTLPEFELKQYKGFEIPKHASEITVEELTQKILQELRMQHAESKPYGENEFIQAGDGVVIQYKSFLNGEELTDLSSEGALLEVGKINVPGFDDAILGMKPEEERDFTLHTPKEFSEKYGDKDILFKVKFMTGSKKIPAALDDELAKRVGLKDYAELNQQAHSAATIRIQGIENAHYQDQVSRRLVTEHKFEVPEWIVKPEAQVQAQMQKKKWDDLNEEERAKFTAIADEGLRLSLVLSKIQEKEIEAQLTEEELFQLAKENIAKVSGNPDQVLQDIAQKGQLDMLLTRVKDEHALNFIIKNSTIVE